LRQTAPLQALTCHTADTVLTATREVAFYLYHSHTIRAGTRFSHPEGMQGWVYPVGLVTYRCVI